MNDRNEFRHRHYINKVRKNDIKGYVGNVYLGLDVGSTTTKAVLIDDNDSLLYSFYDSNEGNPLDVVEPTSKPKYTFPTYPLISFFRTLLINDDV